MIEFNGSDGIALCFFAQLHAELSCAGAATGGRCQGPASSSHIFPLYALSEQALVLVRAANCILLSEISTFEAGDADVQH
jgi:hypothetical protein